MELSRERLVLFTGAGFLGGLAGWAAAEPLAALGNVYLRALLHGAVIGVFVGAFIGAIEGLSAGHKNQTWQGVKLGGLAGLVGGGSGLLMGELAFDLFGGLGGRVIGWSVFGLAAGLVDNKGCAVDEVWSGLRFVVRVKDRGKREVRARRS